MRRVTTRELVHHAKRIQAALARGESFTWTSHGRVVGIIQPPKSPAGSRTAHAWLERARAVGAVTVPGPTLAEAIYADRGEG